jgi:hypothetical protein
MSQAILSLSTARKVNGEQGFRSLILHGTGNGADSDMAKTGETANLRKTIWMNFVMET